MDEMAIEEARRRFADLVNAALWRDEHVVITRHGKRAAVLVSPEWYERARTALGEASEASPASEEPTG
jgi:prevent-host-death family protein